MKNEDREIVLEKKEGVNLENENKDKDREKEGKGYGRGFELTVREVEILKLIIDGKNNVEIAKILFISPHTAKAHVCNILEKMGVENRLQAAVKAVRGGLG